MSRKYVYNSCNKVIEDPYLCKMKEFRIDADSIGMPNFTKYKVKIHLCNNCFKSLKQIAIDSSKGDR